MGDIMKGNIFKGTMIVLTISLLLISVMAVSSADNNTDVSLLTLSKGGITIQYPSDWGSSRALSNYSVMAISKIDSIDAFGIGQVNVNVEKKPFEGDFSEFVNESYEKMQKDSSFQLVSSGSVAIGDKQAEEYIYTSNQNDAQKEHKAVWFEKGGQAYVIMYSAPLDQFEKNLYVFDYILSNIQIT
jgi:hypothetical protein